LSVVLDALQDRRRQKQDYDRQSLVSVVAGLAITEKDRLSAAERAGVSAFKPPVSSHGNHTKKSTSKYKVYATADRGMSSWGESLWTELPGLRKADRAPRDTTGWTLVDGGCGVPMLSVADIAMDWVEKMSGVCEIEGVSGRRMAVDKRGQWRGIPITCCKGAAMNCFNPRYFEVKYGWEQQLLPWRERTIWRLVAADGNEICRASVASDGLVYVCQTMRLSTLALLTSSLEPSSSREWRLRFWSESDWSSHWIRTHSAKLPCVAGGRVYV
jgi:hypothetical protein